MPPPHPSPIIAETIDGQRTQRRVRRLSGIVERDKRDLRRSWPASSQSWTTSPTASRCRLGELLLLAVSLPGNCFTGQVRRGYPYHASTQVATRRRARACVELAKDLFGAEHAYVQPHSGADANLVAYWAILSARVQSPFLETVGQTDPSKLSDAEWAELRHALGNQRMLGLNYYSGGHLSHGYRLNATATMFDVQSYDVDRDTNLLDYDAIRDQAKRSGPHPPRGYSAYSRRIDFSIFREIADEVGASSWSTMAHFAGLVAARSRRLSPAPTTHRTRACRNHHDSRLSVGHAAGWCSQPMSTAKYVDKGCPMVLGGPMPTSWPRRPGFRRGLDSGSLGIL